MKTTTKKITLILSTYDKAIPATIKTIKSSGIVVITSNFNNKTIFTFAKSPIVAILKLTELLKFELLVKSSKIKLNFDDVKLN